MPASSHKRHAIVTWPSVLTNIIPLPGYILSPLKRQVAVLQKDQHQIGAHTHSCIRMINLCGPTIVNVVRDLLEHHGCTKENMQTHKALVRCLKLWCQLDRVAEASQRQKVLT